MIRLSIIIVNYNVKYFLEQALHSVRKAIQNIPAEIIVVDNASSDGSNQMVRQRFPEVQLIANTDNVGFSKANNQGIRIAKGEYILLLNPDTLVQEDTFDKTIGFMDEHPDAGSLGVKMLDGKGNFLPESKRSLPTPSVSFFKIFGFSALFPRSKVFGKYHLGYLSDDEVHEVDVLAGAFMLMRKSVLDEVGLLDEAFFMYGEDIDLSYRIQQGGYKNYYYPHTRIIHYKGESTKKGSLNYVRIFYNAMIIFAKKHFSSQQAWFYSFFIQIAVFLRAIVALFVGFFKKIFLPLLDAGILYLGMYGIKEFWATQVKNVDTYYPLEYMLYVVPAYILIWLISVFFNGGYDKPIKIFRVVRGLAIGTIIIAALYGFLPDDYRFSRAMILLGGMWAVVAMPVLRFVVQLISRDKAFVEGDETDKKVAIAGSVEESKRALSLLNQSGMDFRFIGFIITDEAGPTEENEVLGTADQVVDICEIYDLEEIVFCSRDIATQDIISAMVEIGPQVNYKVIPEKGMSIVGSNSKNTAGDLYAIDVNLSINTVANRRNKRLFDFAISALFILFWPFIMAFQHNRISFVKNCLEVFYAKRSWVGYATAKEQSSAFSLPKIKPGVLDPTHALRGVSLDDKTKARLNLLYAKDYTVSKDWTILLKGFRSLG